MKYEIPQMTGPVECMRGTIGFSWPPPQKKSKIAFSEQREITGTPVKLREEEFGGVVHNPATDMVYECNKTAALIIKQLAANQTPVVIAALIAGEYGTEQDQALKDVEQFMNEHGDKLT